MVWGGVRVECRIVMRGELGGRNGQGEGASSQAREGRRLEGEKRVEESEGRRKVKGEKG